MMSESERHDLDPNTTIELAPEDLQFFDSVQLEGSDAHVEADKQSESAPATPPALPSKVHPTPRASLPAHVAPPARPDGLTGESKIQDLDPNTTLELTLDDLEFDDVAAQPGAAPPAQPGTPEGTF